MKYLISLIFNSGHMVLQLSLSFLLVITTTSTYAYDLQCKLVGDKQFNPATIAPMQAAANNGDLYRVQVDTSNVTFQVNHFPFSTIEGRFSDFEGGLALPEELSQTRQALFIINVSSIATGDDELNDYLKSSAFFNANQFPVIIFVSTDFEWLDDSTARLIGELTLHGMTKKLVFDVAIDNTENDISNESGKMTMQASAEIQRSDFGMHGLQMLVSDTVQFNLKIEAYRIPG